MVDYVFFDLDGTITDSGIGIMNSAQFALDYYGIHNENIENLRRFIGPPLAKSFEDYYGFSKDKAIEAVSKFREYFKVKGIFENKVYAGIEDVLVELINRGKKLVVATSKLEKFAIQVLEYFHLNEYFTFICGSTDSKERDTKGSVISYCIDYLKIGDKSKIVMIGDKHHDIDGAKENGIMSIGVSYGYGSEEELIEAKADFIVSTPLSILDVIEKIDLNTF